MQTLRQRHVQNKRLQRRRTHSDDWWSHCEKAFRFTKCVKYNLITSQHAAHCVDARMDGHLVPLLPTARQLRALPGRCVVHPKMSSKIDLGQAHLINPRTLCAPSGRHPLLRTPGLDRSLRVVFAQSAGPPHHYKTFVCRIHHCYWSRREPRLRSHCRTGWQCCTSRGRSCDVGEKCCLVVR